MPLRFTCSSRSRLLAALLALAAPGGVGVTAQPQFAAKTEAVLVDVIVADGQQRFVSGLAAHDFEILENAVRQEIVSFVEVAPAAVGTASSHTAATAAAPRATPRPGLVAMVIDQLGPEARALAARALPTFLDALGPLDFVAVFAADRGLSLVQPYTNDRERLRAAIRTALMRPGHPLHQHSSVAKAEFGDDGPPQSALDENPYIRGRASLDALQGVVRSLGTFPHRKALLLFSEGLALGRSDERSLLPGRTTRGNGDSWLADGRQDHMRRLLDEANRARVAFYTIDAAGLRTGRVPVEFGRAPYVGLQRLAEETGGVFVQNTNDFRPGVGTLAANLGQYYELGYVPSRAGRPDQLNALEVKVSRPGVSVRARRGYVAGPDPAAIKSFEVVPWLLLQQPTLPRQLRLEAGAIHMPDTARPGRVAVVATVEANQPALQGSPDLTVLVHIKSATGEVVRAASERFGPRQAGGPQTLLFVREPDLPAGVYTMEALVYDAASHQAGARVATLDIRYDAKAPLLMSDVFLARAIVASPAGHTGGLAVAGRLVIPNIAREVRRGTTVVFGFVGQAADQGPLSATVTLRQGAAVVQQLALDLPPPLADGRVPFVGELPGSDALPPGTYQLDVSLQQGTRRVVKSTILRIMAP